VLNGSTNVIVRWNYTLLPGQSIYFTSFIIKNGINSQDTVGIVTGRRSKISNRNGYRTRFSIHSSNEFSTLRINTVTERENATFQCKIDLADTDWAYNIRIEVTGENKLNNVPCLGKMHPCAFLLLLVLGNCVACKNRSRMLVCPICLCRSLNTDSNCWGVRLCHMSCKWQP